ncbi:MAG: 4Fe-4S binding protein, partial [Desulfuromonas sp.]
QLLRAADAHIRAPEGAVAVLIARHGCMMQPGVLQQQPRYVMSITEACIGCRRCVDAFECPALSMDTEVGIAVLDQDRCVGCGTCIHVCPVNAIKGE